MTVPGARCTIGGCIDHGMYDDSKTERPAIVSFENARPMSYTVARSRRLVLPRRMMRGVARWGRGSGWLVASTASWMAVYACSGSDHAPLKGLAEGCLINTDCNAPLVCAFRKCHEACRDSRDCNQMQHQRCVASDRPYHVCQLVEERDCTFNSDCPDRQVCLTGACADLTEVDAGLVSGGLPSDAGTGQRCLYTSECPIPLTCR